MAARESELATIGDAVVRRGQHDHLARNHREHAPSHTHRLTLGGQRAMLGHYRGHDSGASSPAALRLIPGAHPCLSVRAVDVLADVYALRQRDSDAVTVESLTGIRELDGRLTNGIQIRLLWRQHDDRVWVAVIDTRTGEASRIDVRDDESPLDVFRHPFAYAAHHHTELGPVGQVGAATALGERAEGKA